VKEISLTQEQVALVSDEDYERAAQHKWCASKTRKGWVARARVNGSMIELHRFILNAPKRSEVDHENHNGLDCQRHNIRLATRRQNAMNRRGRGKSRFRGVDFDSKWNKWRACICPHRKNRFLGYFQTEEQAALAYNDAARECYGEFACLNDVQHFHAHTREHAMGQEKQPAREETGE
jgi:hypothetical protein